MLSGFLRLWIYLNDFCRSFGFFQKISLRFFRESICHDFHDFLKMEKFTSHNKSLDKSQSKRFLREEKIILWIMHTKLVFIVAWQYGTTFCYKAFPDDLLHKLMGWFTWLMVSCMIWKEKTKSEILATTFLMYFFHFLLESRFEQKTTKSDICTCNAFVFNYVTTFLKLFFNNWNSLYILFLFFTSWVIAPKL